jgi:formate hydrogenlyase subunit 3/multisubunit Na+/H+ antiporter MnhD subunit
MNNLSWMIYLAGVSESLSGFFVFITVIFAILTAIATIVSVVNAVETDAYNRRYSDNTLTYKRSLKKSAFKIAITAFICMIIAGSTSALLPSRQTVLLIAASEIGERVVTSERAQSVIDPSVDLLKTWMQRETQIIQQQMQPQHQRSSR